MLKPNENKCKVIVSDLGEFNGTEEARNYVPPVCLTLNVSGDANVVETKQVSASDVLKTLNSRAKDTNKTLTWKEY